MPRLPGISQKGAVRLFQKLGYRIVRESGYLILSNGERRLVIPRHDPINAITMGAIARDAGLTATAVPPAALSTGGRNGTLHHSERGFHGWSPGVPQRTSRYWSAQRTPRCDTDREASDRVRGLTSPTVTQFSMSLDRGFRLGGGRAEQQGAQDPQRDCGKLIASAFKNKGRLANCAN